MTDAVADEQGGDLAALGEFSRSFVGNTETETRQWMETQHHKTQAASWFSGWLGTVQELSLPGAKSLSCQVSFVPLSRDTTKLR